MKLTPGREMKPENGINVAEEELRKIKRSSGEYQYVTKEELSALNKEKAERRYREKRKMRRWYQVIAAVCLVIIVFVGLYFMLQKIKESYNNPMLATRNPTIATRAGVGRIVVTTNVDGATVFIDSIPVEQTYNKESNLRDIPVGEHTLAVKKSGYITNPESREVAVEEGKTIYAFFTLNEQREETVLIAPIPSEAPSTPIQEPKDYRKPIAVLPPITTDVAPPVVNIATSPFVTISDNIGTINNNSVSFILRSNEPAEFSCYLEGYDSDYGEFSFDEAKQYKDLPDGSYTFYVKARDKSGNETSEPLMSSFIVDTTPPGANIIDCPNGTISQRDITLSFSSSEPSYFSFYLDGYENGYSNYSKTSSINYSSLPDGNYIFYVKAKDDAGNEDSKPTARSFAIDTTAPGASIVKGPESIISQDNITITFAASKNNATFAYYLKGKDTGFGDYTSKTIANYDNLSDCTYTFYVKAKDGIGNVDYEPASLNFTVDTTPPKTRITGGPAGDINYDDVTFTFTASEKATFSYYLEGYDKGFSDYTSETSKTYDNLLDGIYAFHVKSRDGAGNVNKDLAKREFTVKTMVLIFREDFEDEKSLIKAGDFLRSSGADYWGRTQRRTKHGKFSLWCAGVGGRTSTYDKNMNAWYELQIDLSHYNKANLSFWYYLDTTNDTTDQFSLRVNTRDKVSAKDYTGFRALWRVPVNKDKMLNWVEQTINLDSLCGKPVAIRFSFDSDDRLEDEGAYVDSIIIMGKH